MEEKSLINTEKLERELNRFAAFVRCRNYEKFRVYSKYIRFTDIELLS